MSRALTVGDLKNMLEGVDENMEVHISYNYGDYWRTQVAPDATEAEEVKVKYSSYHHMDKIVEEDSDEDDHSDLKTVFVIR
jgi:hypothetical protein